MQIYWYENAETWIRLYTKYNVCVSVTKNVAGFFYFTLPVSVGTEPERKT